MGFSRKVKEELLIASARHCCVCHRYKGINVEAHHITPESQGGENSFENGIILCFDCHADAGHYFAGHPKGIKLSPSELRKHKENWENRVIELQNPTSVIESEFEKLSQDLYLNNEMVDDNEAHNFPTSQMITANTKFLLEVSQTQKEQSFVVYLRIRMANINNYKWIGFGTPTELNNVYDSERVYRIGRPGDLKYQTVEHIVERIKESGLNFEGEPIKIDMVRLWGWHNNELPLTFRYAFI